MAEVSDVRRHQENEGGAREGPGVACQMVAGIWLTGDQMTVVGAAIKRTLKVSKFCSEEIDATCRMQNGHAPCVLGSTGAPSTFKDIVWVPLAVQTKIWIAPSSDVDAIALPIGTKVCTSMDMMVSHAPNARSLVRRLGFGKLVKKSVIGPVA